MRVRAAMMLLRIGLKVDLDEKVANLSISHKQMLEIAKTLMLDAKVMIMDEPTSSLTNKEVDYLFLIMNQLRKEGTAIVYISHKLAETPHLRPLHGHERRQQRLQWHGQRCL
jgi:ABC-type sugar transport system ATPase subunit